MAVLVLASDEAAPVPPLDLRLVWRHRLTIFLHTRVFFFFPGDDDGFLGLLDGDELEAKTACGHRAPPPRAVAMAMSADDLMAHFLCWRLIMAAHPEAEDEMQNSLQAWRLKIMFLRKPCWKALVLGPRIALIELEK